MKVLRNYANYNYYMNLSEFCNSLDNLKQYVYKSRAPTFLRSLYSIRRSDILYTYAYKIRILKQLLTINQCIALSDYYDRYEKYYDECDSNTFIRKELIMEIKDYFKIPTGLKEVAKEYTLNYIKENTKNHFGIDIYIDKYIINQKGSNNNITNYLRTIIKDFDKRVLTIDKTCKNDILLFEKIDKGTFIVMMSTIYSNRAFKEKLIFDRDVSNNTIYMYVFGKHSPKYARIITNQIKKTEKDTRSQSIYVVSELSSKNSNVQHLPLQQRDIGTMYYSNNEVETITKFIDRYESSEEYYNKLELSYKTGILLYGNPGTGKSSLVKTIAHKYNREICQVDVTNISEIDLSMLTNLINNDNNCKYIVLFEDIDTMMLDRQGLDQNNETVKKYKDNINRLLQFLDSSSSPNNVIFIATTNYYDKLDKALIREGRFDLKLKVNELKEEDLPKYMEHLQYKGSIESVKEAYGKNTTTTFNQSKLQNVIVNLREQN